MKRAGVKSSFFILLYTQNPSKIDTNTKALLKIGTKNSLCLDSCSHLKEITIILIIMDNLIKNKN